MDTAGSLPYYGALGPQINMIPLQRKTRTSGSDCREKQN
jgi:hypothetical protein